MYYLGIKCNMDDPYDLNYLDFYFDDIQEMFNFAESILSISTYEIVIQTCSQENE